MSEILIGVLRMPPELFWSDDDLTRLQHDNIRREAADEIERLQAENAALKARTVAPTDNGIAYLDSICSKFNDGKIDLGALVCRIWNNRQKEVGALEARVAELEGLVRDIRQHDINETTKRLLEGGRKFNYSLPLSIRERIAAALKEPANEC